MALKTRVLHLIQSLDNGGCENMLLRTLPLLTDFEHHIITLKSLGELAPQFSERGISVTCIHQGGLWDIPSYGRLLKEVRAQDPEFIITYLLHADILGRLFLQQKTASPVIPFLRTTYNDSRYILARLFERFTARLVEHYLANSQAVKRFYVDNFGIPESRITVIENGIDMEVYENAEPNETLKQELGITAGDLVLISVANLHKNKGHRYLLEAFEKIFTERQNIHLLVVGDGAEKESLLRQVAPYTSRKHIHFLGKRSDVPSLLKTSHIFVLPTLFEGMSNAILEAMAAGLPVVTTDIAENREILENGKDGILVEPAKSRALAEEITDLLDDEKRRRELGENARETLIRRFSLAAALPTWHAFISNSILKEYGK